MNRNDVFKLGAGIALFLIILGVLLAGNWGNPSNGFAAGNATGTNTELGISIFESYGLTFFVLGLLMFIAMLGGVFLAQEES